MNIEKLLNHKGRHKKVAVEDLIMPIFVREDIESKNLVSSMPGIFQYTVGEAVDKALEIEKLAIPAIIIFGIPRQKSDTGDEAFNSKGIVQKAIRAIKQKSANLIVIADCCLCAYTKNGECGLIVDGTIDNDLTREALKKIAVSQAQAGADIIAPSGMITYGVEVIRKALDQRGFSDRKIMSYSAKYASSFYSPFREAGGTAFAGPQRKTQLDSFNTRLGVEKVLEDIKQGADFTMVKPALSYLDVIAKVRCLTDISLVAYNVSGEYSLVKFAAQNGAIDEIKVTNEILLSIKRAGADLIITYFAEDLARRLLKK
ncbi:MAG: porphobilinogen synthase [Candidatus Omnitrophota bacterium]